MTSPASAGLRDWLQAQGLEDYAEALEREQITLDQLPDLTDQDLKDIGIAALGPRKRLLKAASELQSSPAASISSAAPAPVAQSESATTPAPTPAQSPAHPEAQRRQLTVMFCDLVGSTSLSTQLDPEDLRELIARYHQQVSRQVNRAGGFVAKFMGDGVLVYFGYPQASENDAERAVRAGLAIVDDMASGQALGRDDLQVRVGIATGTVVVGDLVVEGTAPERSVVGETPNLAARLQSLAAPGQVVIGASTRRLLGELFELQDLGALTVKGFAEPVQAWQVLRASAASSRFEAQRAGALSRFVGRDSEVALLMERWELAADGEGQVVLVSGEAGIGKSRITTALRQRVGQAVGGREPLVLLWQCSPLHSGTSLHPVIQQLQQAVQTQPGLEPTLLAAGVAEGARSWVLRLAGVEVARHTGLDPSVEKTNTLYAVVEALQALASQQPVLLLVEDAHWIDPSTEELLALAAQQLRPHRAMLVVTSRPGYEPSWQQAPNLTRLALSRLAQRQCLQLAQEVAREMVHKMTGQWNLPAALLEQIVKRTDGVPLFVEELTKAVLEAGLPHDVQQGWQVEGLATLAIPTTLQDSLTARLDRLQPAPREVAQAASVIGREFSQALLREVLKPMSAEQVAAALEELQRAELVYLRLGSQSMGTFKHALVRDAAYGSLLKAPRAQWHAKVAQAMVTIEPQLVEQQPEVLAGHWQQAGELAAALELWRKAGDIAFSRSSLLESAEHYRLAIALCAAVQPAPEVECHLQMQLSSALTQSQGYGSEQALQAAQRALELCTREAALRDHYPEAARAAATILVSRGSISKGESLFDAANPQVVDQGGARGTAPRFFLLGAAAALAGRFEKSLTLLTNALELVDRAGAELTTLMWGGTFPRVAILLWLDQALMMTGRLEQGLSCTQEALTIARNRNHPPTLTWAMMNMVNWLHLAGRNAEAVELMKEAVDLAERFQIKPRIAVALVSQGRSLVLTGRMNDGNAMMRRGMQTWLETSSTLMATLLVTNPASAMASVGHVEAVQEYLDIGNRLMRDTEERIGHAELLRLQAWVYRKSGDPAGARTALESALSVAQDQGAKLFALRAAVDLVKLTEGSEHEARAVAELQRAYAGFSEGFEFPMMVGARKMLQSRGLH